jgi:hypothetical protein
VKLSGACLVAYDWSLSNNNEYLICASALPSAAMLLRAVP